MVSKVSFLLTWPFWTRWFWYNDVSFRSEFFSAERLNAEFSPPTIILSLSWSRSDILRDNFLVVQLWSMIFFTQCQVLSKKSLPIMHNNPNALIYVWNKKKCPQIGIYFAKSQWIQTFWKHLFERFLKAYPPESGSEESLFGFADDLTKLKKGDPLHLYNSNSLENHFIIIKKVKSYPSTVSNNLQIMINIKFITRN